jgi:NTP pyrophosphatase (non-canonical NTP hydrolase)
VTLREWKARVHELAREKGWWDGHGTPPSTDAVLAKLALIHSEVSECVEEARVTEPDSLGDIRYGTNGKPEGFAIELADVIIRALDLAGALGIDIEAAVAMKHRYNMTRPHRHGGKLA